MARLHHPDSTIMDLYETIANEYLAVTPSLSNLYLICNYIGNHVKMALSFVRVKEK